ncbi:MAG: diaminopimelate decarboxylase [Candidatus Competibacteraceae bacterium]|nr:MAG: diaminopimelate decarboxylase [Candidatus Competibacteraceae bacterium]
MQAAVARGLLGEEHLLAAFIDMDGTQKTVASLRAAFDDHFTHAFAAKANCLHRVLALLRACGMGCEVASPGEFAQARRAGFLPHEIVLDSPAKTLGEIEQALRLGIALNIDNFQELERVTALMATLSSNSEIGVRINPQVGVGAIAATSTATRTSKFGIPLEDEGQRARLIQAYIERPWLTGVHTHVGSQGCSLELIASGVAKVVAFAEEINAAVGRRQVRVLDIGGGLPVNFASDEFTPSYAEYAALLRARAPALFSGAYRVITEFGRSIMAKNGFIAARVEYTKTSGDRHIAITHAGAQVAARTVFMPEMWAIRLSAFDAQGRFKRGKKIPQDVAGPCCFAGDILAHERPLPLLEPGDFILAHDTGAYYFSTPFQYNSLPDAAVYGFHIGEDNAVRFELLRAEESIDHVVETSGRLQ